jgi:hypothetical protein
MKTKQIVTTHDQLLDWLEVELLASRPKRPINSGIVGACLEILSVVRFSGNYSVLCTWDEMILALFLDINGSTSSPHYPTGLIGFGSLAYGEIIEHGEITIEDVNRILIEILRHDEKRLRIRKVRDHWYLESTQEWVRKCRTVVRVKLQQPERWHSCLVIDDSGRAL